MINKQQIILGNEQSFLKKLTYDAAVVFLASLLIGLSGIISFKIPLNPVPISLQMHVVLFVAATLGSKRGFLATAAFLVQGAMGWPVFSLGSGGVPILLGPTGGYLIGYAIAAFATGYLVESAKNKSSLKVFLAYLLGNGIVYTTGAYVLSNFIGVANALFYGTVPFILGDLFKSIIFTKAFALSKR